MQQRFLLRHPEATNKDLAEEFGVSVAGIERAAFLLGSKKSKAFKAASRPPPATPTKTVTPITYAPGALPWRAQAMQTTWTPPPMTYRGQAKT